MNALQESNNHSLSYRDFLEKASPGKNGDSNWLYEIKRSAYERFKNVGLPTKKNEAWKYINLDSVLNSTFSFLNKEKANIPNSSYEKALAPYFLNDTAHERIVFTNGVFSENLSSIPKMPNGIILQNLKKNNSPIVKSHFEKNLTNETNPFVLINTFHFDDGILVYVPKNELVQSPIHVLLAQLDDSLLSATASDLRLIIVLDENAQASIVLDHISLSPKRCFMNIVTEIYLNHHAKLNWLNVQRETEETIHFHTIKCHQKENSSFESLSFTQGGLLTRNETFINFEEENAACDLKGLTVIDENSQVFNHVTIDHAKAHCSSRQFFKNILAGSSKSEVNSLVHVYPNAQKSDSNQLLRNLLLSRSARAYSRPQLQIHADDVKATHGATTGQLEQAELFYLKSRGLNEQLARFILTYGFAEEIVEQISFPSIRTQVEEVVRQAVERIVK